MHCSRPCVAASVVCLILATFPTLCAGFAATLGTSTSTSTSTVVLPTRPDLKVTWETSVSEQIEAALSTKQSKSNKEQEQRPFMVGVVGVPGSGKSTGADILRLLLGEKRCLTLPMDGYHYSKKELQQLPDADDMLYRRGAPDTFDATRLHKDLQAIRSNAVDTLHVPGFDHAVGDPEPNVHTYCRSQHDIVITEGLYLLHDQHGWQDIKSCFDWTVFVDANVDVCMERLKIRNLSIPGYTREEIFVRVDAVDRVNAGFVEQSKQYADCIVPAAAF